MKREIKFRGKQRGWEKHPDWGWFYGNLYVKDNSGRTHIGNIHRGCLDIAPQTVGQLTGLKDKNGREIYEGDILTTDTNNTVVVTFEYGCFGFRFLIGDAKSFNEVGAILSFIPFICCLHLRDIEVIGNIHDDPELLEERT